ncbi:hypothetical protein D3C78_1881940 [compost metagenome]
MLPLLAGHLSLVFFTNIFGRRYKKTCCTASWVNDLIIRCGRKQTDHQVANMLGRSELTILTSRSQFA